MALNFGAVQEDGCYFSRTVLCRFIYMHKLNKTLVLTRILDTKSAEILRLLANYYDCAMSTHMYSS
jgi:hypothetical protein